ncbi:MAG: hypothetical protein U0805_20895 [Pirellulales bacterium]
MSALLNIKGDSTADWCGRVIIPGPRPPIAQPMVVARKHNASLLMSIGALTESGSVMLGAVMLEEARRHSNDLVYLVLGIPAGRIGGLRLAGDSLREAGRHAAIIVYLQECCFGPGLWLAHQCNGLVFSHPATQIGYLQCIDAERGEFDPEASLGMVMDMHELNPEVSTTKWAKLADQSISAELAEASGILKEGSLKRDVFQLSGFDPNVRLA